ncbi:MAG: hypothetical protein AAFZ65_04070 [Planctomycetota bacterium]
MVIAEVPRLPRIRGLMPLDSDLKYRRLQINYQGIKDRKPRPRRVTVLDVLLNESPDLPPILEARCNESNAVHLFRVDRIQGGFDVETGECYDSSDAILRSLAPDVWLDWAVAAAQQASRVSSRKEARGVAPDLSLDGHQPNPVQLPDSSGGFRPSRRLVPGGSALRQLGVPIGPLMLCSLIVGVAVGAWLL